MGFRLDLHSHSILSRDGGLTPAHFTAMFSKGVLNGAAITDHGQVEFAFNLQKELPAIIVGEEIRTTTNDIIGLYLTRKVEQNQTLAEAIKDIHDQGGLVYAPHPGESWRRGITYEELEIYVEQIDIIEVFNGKTRNRATSERARQFARAHNKPMASSSDAHGKWGMGTAYTEIAEAPTRETLIPLLSAGTLICNNPPLFSVLYPKFNIFKHRFFPSHAV